MNLTDTQRKFVLHWGEMGTKWGVNRTVAQIHALLYIAGRPLNAEEIADTLTVARSNVSNSLRELQSWGIVRVTHKLGDRCDYFETLTDVWEIFRIVMNERKRREIDPTIRVLRECVAELKTSGSPDDMTRDRLGELLTFIEFMSTWYERMRVLPPRTLETMAKLGGKLESLLAGFTGKKGKAPGETG